MIKTTAVLLQKFFLFFCFLWFFSVTPLIKLSDKPLKVHLTCRLCTHHTHTHTLSQLFGEHVRSHLLLAAAHLVFGLRVINLLSECAAQSGSPELLLMFNLLK